MADSPHLFHQITACLLQNWAALQLAVQHCMGGTDSVAKSQWLIGAVQQYIEENNGLEVDEIEDFLEDFLNSEFNTIADDGSTREIAVKLFNYYKIYRDNDYKRLEEAIRNLPKFDSTLTKECASFSGESSQSAKPSVCEAMDQMQIDLNEPKVNEDSSNDDGWQTVIKGRTKHRK